MWFVAVLIERLDYDDTDPYDPTRECSGEESIVLIEAGGPDEAYGKAEAHGKALDGVGWTDTLSGRTGKYSFAGIAELLPVYDKLEDGAELLSTEYHNTTAEHIDSLVTPRDELQVFEPDAGNDEKPPQVL